MSRAAFSVTKWKKYRDARLYGTTMGKLIDADLKHLNPPSSDTIVELILLGDIAYMTAMLTNVTKHPLLKSSHSRGMSIAAISHTPTHPFYKKISNAFGYANSRKKKAGLSLDRWPIPITAPVSPPIPRFGQRAERVSRRLVWSLNRQEVCAARGMFKRYVRDGLVPFLVGLNGEALERVTTFDPASCEVLFKPKSEN